MSCGCSECNKKYGGIPRPPLSYKAGGKSPKASMSCGQVKRSTRPGKKIMKLYCIDGKKKLVHAGAKGYGHNYSAAARKSFKARHKCSTAKPGTARHLACTELWAGKGGSKKSSPKGRKGKYADGGPHSVPPDLFSETLATQQAPKQAAIAPATPLMSFSMDSSAPAPSIYNTGNQGPSSLAEVPNSVMYSRDPRGVNFTVQTGMKGKTPTYTTIPFSALQNSLNDPSFFTGDDAGYYREFAIKQLQKGMPLTLDEKGRASIPFTSAQKRAFSGPSEEQYDEVLSSDEYLQAFLNKAEDPGALKQTKYRTAKAGPKTGGMQVNLLNLPKISPCPPGTLHCPGFAAGGYKKNYAVGGPYLNINPYNPLNESDFDLLYKNKGQGEMDLSKRQQRRISRRQTGRNIGATAYGVLEGLVDTISFGLTDALTDKGYEALAGLGREQSESRKKQSARYRGVGQTVGATAGAILTGGSATGSAVGTTDYDLFANEGPKSLQTGLKVAGTVAGVAVGNTSGVEGTGGALGGTAVGDISAKLGQTSSFGATGTGPENLLKEFAPNFKDGIDGFKEFQESNPEGTLGEFLQQNPEVLQKALEGLGMVSGAQVNKYGGLISYRAGGRRYPHGGYHPPTNQATRADSLAVYTGAMDLAKAFKDLGYTQTLNSESVPNEMFTDARQNSSGLLKQKDGTLKVNPNFDPDLEGTRLMGTARARDARGRVPKGYSSLEKIDDYKYKVSELLAHFGYNTDLPYVVLDERIAPQGVARYDLNPPKGVDTAEMLYYDPIAIAPIDQLTPEQIKKRVDKYGNSGVPIRYQDPNKPGYGVQGSGYSPTMSPATITTTPQSSSVTTTPPSRPRIDIEPMQPITLANYSTETPSLNVNLNRYETDKLIDTQNIYRTPLFNKNNIRGRKRPLTQVGERRIYERPDGTRYTAVDRFDREMIRDLKRLRNPKRRQIKSPTFQTGGPAVRRYPHGGPHSPTDPPKESTDTRPKASTPSQQWRMDEMGNVLTYPGQYNFAVDKEGEQIPYLLPAAEVRPEKSGLDAIDAVAEKYGAGILGDYDPTDPRAQALEQNMRDARGNFAAYMVGTPLAMTADILSAPQRYLINPLVAYDQGVEADYQPAPYTNFIFTGQEYGNISPSMLYGIENPYGAAAVDIAMDPMFIRGAMKGIERVALPQLIKKTGKPVKDLALQYTFNPGPSVREIAKGTGQEVAQASATGAARTVAGETAPARRAIDSPFGGGTDYYPVVSADDVDASRVVNRDENLKFVERMEEAERLHGVKNKEAIARGNQWLADWKNSPATIEKVQAASGDLPEETVKAMIHNQPNVGEYPLDELRVIAEASTSDTPIPMRGVRGQSYDHHSPYGEEIYGAYVSRNPNMSQARRESTTVHEGTHSLWRHKQMEETGQFDMFRKNTDLEYLEANKYYQQMRRQGYNFKTAPDPNKFWRGYIANPAEQHARVMQIRHAYGLKPSEKVTRRQAKKILTDLNSGNFDHLITAPKLLAESFGNNPRNVKNVFNKAFQIAAPVAGAAAATTTEEEAAGGTIKYKKGGSYQGGLRRWFKEEWKDVKTGKPCGRKSAKGSSRPYPYCRPSRKVSSKTPATSKHSEAKSRARQKTGPSRVKPISQRKRK